MFCWNRDDDSVVCIFPCIERDKKVILDKCDTDEEEDACLVFAEPLPDSNGTGTPTELLPDANGVDALTCREIGKTGPLKHEEDSCFDIVITIGELGMKSALKLVLGVVTVILTCLPDPKQLDPEPLAEDDGATDRIVAAIEVLACERRASATTNASDALETISEADEDQQTDSSDEEPTAETAST